MHALSRSYKLNCRLATNYRDILGHVDAVVNALPNHLHAPVNLDFLDASVHVLCEKPLAITATEARACCEMAERRGVVLAVGMQRRFYESTQLMHPVLQEVLHGSVTEYSWEHGVPFAWNTASGFYFSREQSGGGVLLDEGVHLLDCLLDWFGPVRSLDYQDDNRGGGIEANVLLDLRHSGVYGDVSGQLRLSRTYTLRNRLLVRGDRRRLEIPRSDPDALVLYRAIRGHEVSMTIRLSKHDDLGVANASRAQLNNFLDAIQGRCRPVVDGRQALETIELIERCYAHARHIPEPWSQDSIEPTDPKESIS